MAKPKEPMLPFDGKESATGMRFVLAAKDMRDSIERIARVVDDRSGIPILRNVLLKTGDGFLELTGTDLDREVSVRVPARSEKPAEATIEVSRLAAFAGDLPDDVEIGATITDRQAEFRSGKRQAKLAVLPSEDFPHLAAEMDDACSFDVSAAVAARIAALVEIAEISQRQYLGGAHLFTRGKQTFVEAGGSAMCAREALTLNAKVPSDWTVVIPVDTARLLPALFGDCEMEISRNKLRASDGRVTLVSKLVDAPAYPTNIIDKATDESERPLSVAVDAKAFNAAIRRLTLLSADAKEEASRVVRVIAADAGRARLVTEANGLSAVHAEDEIDAECTFDPAGVQSFTIRTEIASKLLKAINADTIRLSQSELGMPLLVEAIGNEKIRASLSIFRRQEIVGIAEAA